MNLKPFFCYYGGKWRAAPHYPAPIHDAIIEPFGGGGAGYSLRHHHKQVTLYDVDPIIVGVWHYLIHVTPGEVLALPDVVDEIPSHLPQEAKWLIGFWLNKGTVAPCKTPSAWMRMGTHLNSFWGSAVRERLARQVPEIRHWQVQQKTYREIDTPSATWFVDPPYNNKAGAHYRFSDVDYEDLGRWCRSLSGQVMVCDNVGATWLPFQPFLTVKANESKTGGHRSKEALWENGPKHGPPALFRKV